MARALFPRRRSATPSKAPASAPAGDGNGIGVSAFCPPAAPSSSSAPAPSSLPSTPAGSSDRGQASPGASAAASKDRKGKRSSQSNLEIPSTTAPTSSPPSKSTVNASLTRLQASVARRQQHARAAAAAPPPSSSPASSSLSSAEIERLWEEDHAVLLAAVEALAGAAGGRGDAPAAAAAAAAAAALPATPPADRRGRRRPRPPSSGPTPPPPPLPSTEKARVADAAAGEEEGGSDDLTLPVALWLRRHEPLLREAAAAAAEARTFDTEAAILSLCAREGISPEKLAEECAKLSPFSSSSSSSSSSEGQNFNPLGIDVAVALDRAAELRVALANFDEDARGDAPGFVTAADEDTLRVRYRHIKGTSEHTVRFEATILAPLEHLLALCSEIDLAPRWNRFVVDAAVVARTAAFCSFYYASQWSPRPFPQMDSCVRVRGHDGYDSSARGAVVCLESWPREKAAGAGDDRSDRDPVSLDLPAAAARRHRVLVLPGSCIVLAPIRPCPATGAERTRGILLVTLDPRLPFVPSFLVAWVLRVLAPSIKRGIDAVMASWFSPGEGGEGGFDGAAPGAAAAAAAAARTGRSGGGGGGEAGVEMRRRLVNRPELYDLAKRLVARHAEERGGDLPASPARPVPPARTTAGTGSGGLWRSSSEIPAAAAAGAALRRRSSTFSAVPASVSAVVDGAIARLSRMSSGGGGGGGGFGGGAAAAATAEQQQQPPSSSEEDQGWISWLARPLSATASYASSLLHVERTVPS